MKKLITRSLNLISEIKRHQRVIMIVIMTGLFVLAAGAPNATIGIGK